ncbi:MAG: HD domain-containing protein [Synergistaceae bacterium]|nr:HD domain-containing protein [Synergistaceae bacterium]
MFTDFKKIKEWFREYTHTFNISDSMIQMKYRHSFEVMNIGRRLTEALNWTEPDAAAGVSACLLHDTGRFSQYAEFGTYYDGVSIDHGERGYEVLKEALPSDAVDDGAREAILAAVRLHNKKELPDLPPNLQPFCQLARDSDKLDVFALVDRRIREGTISTLLPRHKIDAPLSEALIDEVEHNWKGSYKNAKSLQDFLLIQLTWVLDINFAPSLRILDEYGVLPRIREHFPMNDARVQNLLDRLFRKMEEHLQTRP